MSTTAAEISTTTPLPVLLRHWAELQGDEPALTFLDHTRDPGGLATTLTWAELDGLVDAIAAEIGPRCTTGDRVAILVEQSANYVASFLAVIRAGLVAVPLYPPGLPRYDERLAAVLADCAPALQLTTAGRVTDVERLTATHRLGATPAVPVDALPRHRQWPDIAHDPDDIAYLQYTSGSTRAPAGVVLTHANVFANASQAVECFEVTHGRSVCVSWLPLFHDMGLMLGAATALLGGVPVVLLDPGAFLEQPVRWLRALSANPGAITAAPSFAYAYAAARTTPQDRMLLRLDGVDALIDGSEPVAHANIDRFHDTFAECGLRRSAHRPSYGLAEATVLVTTSPTGAEPCVRTFDAAALAAGTATERAAETASASEPPSSAGREDTGSRPTNAKRSRSDLERAAGVWTERAAEAGSASERLSSAGREDAGYRPANAERSEAMSQPANAEPQRGHVVAEPQRGDVTAPGLRTSTLVSSGTPVRQRVLVVDPHSGRPVRDGTVGEVWVCGANVAAGYWRQPEQTAHTFGATVPGEAGRWLRTGDLGVLVDSQLFITGRLKDLVIVDGRNHYPQDIEHTVEHAHAAIRRHANAAFAVSTVDGSRERLVVLAERAKGAGRDTDTEVTAAVRAAVSAAHGIAVHDLVLLDPGEVPRTSSGKISRSASRALYLAREAKP